MAIRVFLSFAQEDIQKIKRLIPALTNPGYELDFYDDPPGPDAGDRKCVDSGRAIGEKIVKSNLTVCLIGENTHKSSLVDHELQKSRQKGNKIIAMALKGTEYATLPVVVREENLTFYPWNPHKLAELIIK